jgi:hypothetical protein
MFGYLVACKLYLSQGILSLLFPLFYLLVQVQIQVRIRFFLTRVLVARVDLGIDMLVKS